MLGPVSPCRTVKGSIHAYREQRRGRPSFSTAGSEQTGGWHFFPLVATFETLKFQKFHKSLQGNRLELGQFSRRSIGKRLVAGPFFRHLVKSQVRED